MDYMICLHKINIEAANLTLALSGSVPYLDDFTRVRLILHFDNGLEDRRLPFVLDKTVHEAQTNHVSFSGKYTYLLDYLFWKTKNSSEEITMHFNLQYGSYYEENIPVSMDTAALQQDTQYYVCRVEKNILHIIPKNMSRRTALDHLRQQRLLGNAFWHKLYLQNIKKYFDRRYIKQCFNKYKSNTALSHNRIAFISERRNELSDNFQFVYNALKNDSHLDIRLYMNPKEICDMSRLEMAQFAYLCATSKVIVLNEFTPNIYLFDLRQETKVIQLWHACGAFKTFGFSRLGKPMATLQDSRHHRNYDYVTVSSSEICKWYAEGFGVPTSHIIPTGIPRTDVFFDPEYKKRVQMNLFRQHPQLEGKKIILFAPTFRGDIRENAFYPMEQFQIDSFLNAIGEEYFLIIKHHPFVKERHPIPESCKERVLDLTDGTEINDLLFITDLIITDYSSLIFEASLLNIPMIFYTFDLEEYIKDRDFYYSFTNFAPGPFVFTQDELQATIINASYDNKQAEAFAKTFFDDFDGQSTKRVVDLLYQALNE